jgi:hypothetical protein
MCSRLLLIISQTLDTCIKVFTMNVVTLVKRHVLKIKYSSQHIFQKICKKTRQIETKHSGT